MSLVWLHDETLSEEYTKESGYTWTIHDKSTAKELVEVFHNGDDEVGIRMETEGHVDLMILSHGQTYDLLKALSKALGVNS